MAGDGEIKDHEATYGGFISLLKTGTIATIVVTVAVVWLIAS